MKYLIDTNVLLEVGLKRQHSQEAEKFLRTIPPADLAVADFSLHSLGFYLVRKSPELFDELVTDLLSCGVDVLRIEPERLVLVSKHAKLHGLDFDDAFLYTVAELHDLQIISFDSDFDRTPRGRRTPAQILPPTP